MDAFGKLRVTEPFTLFDSTNIYNKNDKFSEKIIGTGSTPHTVNTSSIALSIAGANSRVIRESTRVFCYQPGKSLLILCSFVFGPGSTGLIQNVGYFDSQNGIFVQLNGTTCNIVKRVFVTGVVVDTVISQSNWNMNTYSTLDVTKSQIFFIDFEWLGVGNVRTGFVLNGQFIITHIFNHPNIVSTTYMTTPNLPIRYEINNPTGTVITSALTQICSTVISEGGYQPTGNLRTLGSGYSNSFSLGNNTLSGLIAIRLRSAKINGIVIPANLNLLSTTSGNIYYRIILNPTITVSAYTAFTNFSGDTSNSAVEYALSPNITYAEGTGNGTVVGSGYIQTRVSQSISDITTFALQLGRSINTITTISGIDTVTYTSDIILIVATGVSSNNQSLLVDLQWYEV